MIRPLTIALAGALLATGCGGTPDPAATRPAATTTAEPVSHHAFVAELDATCSGHDRQEQQFKRELAAAGDDLGRLEQVVARVTDAVRPHLRAQEALVAPSQDRSAFRAYLRAQHRYLGALVRMRDDLRRRDVASVRYDVGTSVRARQARTDAALDLGSRVCG